jgi:hypothetical protein
LKNLEFYLQNFVLRYPFPEQKIKGVDSLIRNDIKETLIYKEMCDCDREIYFSYIKNKFLHGIDNIYYSVFLKDDNLDLELCSSIKVLIEKLEKLKEDSKKSKDNKFDETYYFKDINLVFRSRRFKIYEFSLGISNFCDIFISSYLPNLSTPRIVIQLRSLGLWNMGEDYCLNHSLLIVKRVLNEFGISIKKVQENRIDFSYHTNAIQNPRKFFTDNVLDYNVDTTLDIYMKVGRKKMLSESEALRLKRKKRKTFITEYLSLGQRISNNVFFRTYNKTREVIEMNYKGFFIDKWKDEGLISQYDSFVLNYAYSLGKIKGSYDDVEWGKIEFYLQYGKDEKIKEEMRNIKKKYSSNLIYVRDYLYYKLPEVTLIMNVEYQTMRKFYYYSDKAKFIEQLPTSCNNEFKRIYQILDNRKVFLDYLTSTTVSFKKSNWEELQQNYLVSKGKALIELDKKELSELDKIIHLDWWWRLRNLKVKSKSDSKFVRAYPRNLDLQKLIARLKGDMASINLYLGKDDTCITQDFSYVLNMLNDNSFADSDNIFFVDDETGQFKKFNICDDNYENVKEKKKKALGSLIKDVKKAQGTSSKNN